MLRGRHRASFDQVSEFDRGRIAAYRDCELSFREIGQRVGRNQATCYKRRAWNDIVFTDESRFILQHHKDRIRVWRHRDEKLLNCCVMHRHTDSAPGIMVWGGAGFCCRTSLVRIAGTLNS
ncbi:transposable element Tcb1 transposase [Trichonephila clavipes]|nr:transposable element Tcb1 transposase [Trichonephila clavipes]